ncbi:MAG: glycosyltransferase [Sulfitobacter sp. SK025]|nr:MAG: glycosyltransferase [Sulfitobacter sp. SK025]
MTLMNGLDRKVFAPELIVFEGQGPLAGMVAQGIPVADLGVSRLRHALPALIKTIRKVRPDIVFSTLGYVNLALLAARPMLPRNTRIVVREANMPSLSLPRASHSHLLRFAYRRLYRTADAVICTSEQMIDELKADFGVSAKLLCLVPNPVNEEQVRTAAAPITRVAGDGIRLVAAGRLSRQKGFDRLINMMVDIDPTTCLTILGEGAQREELEAQILALKLFERVQLAGFCENPWAYYAGADAFVMTSRWEGLPNAALEALACGTPVIATPESGGIAEIAEAAQPEAVSLAEVGPDFISRLEAVSPFQLANSAPRLSLLPDCYHVIGVVKKFQKVLANLL